MRSASPDPNHNRAELSSRPKECGACQAHDLTFVTNLPIYIRDGFIPDTIWRCANCHSYQRAANFSEIRRLGHFDVASYTNMATEQHRLKRRHNFFRYLAKLLERSFQSSLSGKRALDIGCGAGHFLDILRDRGAKTLGIEIADQPRNCLSTKGHTAFSNLSDIDVTNKLDIVSMVDSLYYINNPRDYLAQLHKRLRHNGRLLLRTTNRTPLFELFRLIGKPISDSYAGDAKHHFSYRGLTEFLTNAGFRIERLVLWERGKQHPNWRNRLYYVLTPALSHLTGRKLSPGLVVIARPS